MSHILQIISYMNDISWLCALQRSRKLSASDPNITVGSHQSHAWHTHRETLNTFPWPLSFSPAHMTLPALTQRQLQPCICILAVGLPHWDWGFNLCFKSLRSAPCHTVKDLLLSHFLPTSNLYFPFSTHLPLHPLTCSILSLCIFFFPPSLVVFLPFLIRTPFPHLLILQPAFFPTTFNIFLLPPFLP